MRSFVSIAALAGCILCSAFDTQGQSYAFSTLAGLAGQAGFTNGIDGHARLHEPAGIAVDSSGNIYVADTLNHTIRQLTPSANGWVVSTLAGLAGATGTNDGPGSSARFFFPYGIAVDSAGTVYVADTYNQTIRTLTSTGTNWWVNTIAGSPGAHGSANGVGGAASFYYPSGLAVDNAGNLFVADTYNHTIREVSPGAGGWNVTTPVGLAGAPGSADGTNNSAQFNFPYGIAVTGVDQLYVADTYNSTIRSVTPSGNDWVVSTVAGLHGFAGSADGTNHSASFEYPFGVAVDTAGNLYVADTYNDTIREVTPIGTNWIVRTLGGAPGISGSTDEVGNLALFYQPEGLATDSSGNLFIADTYNDTIRFGQRGLVLTAIRAGNRLILSWPATATNYVLETSAVAGATALWTPATNGVVQSGNSFFLTNNPTAGAAFFRLHQQ